MTQHGFFCFTHSTSQYKGGSICIDMSRMDKILEIHRGLYRPRAALAIVTVHRRGRLGFGVPSRREVGRNQPDLGGESNTSLFPSETDGITSTTTLLTAQLDPGPGAAIGGMIATGCSGSTCPCDSKCPLKHTPCTANAVKYGTARGEWFLNLVGRLPIIDYPLS